MAKSSGTDVQCDNLEQNADSRHGSSQLRSPGLTCSSGRQPDIELALRLVAALDDHHHDAAVVCHDRQPGSFEPESPRFIETSTRLAARLAARLVTPFHEPACRPLPLDVNAVLRDEELALRRLLPPAVHASFLLGADVPPALVDRSQLEHVLGSLVAFAAAELTAAGTLVVETARIAAAASSPHDLHPPRVMLAVRASCRSETPANQPDGQPPALANPDVAAVCFVSGQSRGCVTVASSPGQGVSITVVLPQAPTPSIARSKPGLAPAADLPRCVLVVDDDECIRDVAARYLELAGWNVLVADGGEEALALWRRHPADIDVVLADVVMPGMSGPELVAKMKKSRPDLLAVFMSGFVGSLRSELELDPKIPFVAKPFEMNELDGMLRDLLETAGKAVPPGRSHPRSKNGKFAIGRP